MYQFEQIYAEKKEELIREKFQGNMIFFPLDHSFFFITAHLTH